MRHAKRYTTGEKFLFCLSYSHNNSATPLFLALQTHLGVELLLLWLLFGVSSCQYTSLPQF